MSKPWTASVIGSQPTLQILYTCTIRYTPKQTPLPPCILCIVWEQNQPCVLLLRMMIACLPRVLISGSHKDQLMQVEVRSNCNGSIQWKISYLHWKSTMENRVLMKWKCWRWWASIPIASICCPQYFIVCNIAHSEYHVTVCYNVYTVIDLEHSQYNWQISSASNTAHSVKHQCSICLQYTELTCGGSIYPHIDALKISTGITYLTAEDSCCVTLRVTVEKYCSKYSTIKATSPSSVIW